MDITKENYINTQFKDLIEVKPSLHVLDPKIYENMVDLVCGLIDLEDFSIPYDIIYNQIYNDCYKTNINTSET